MQTESDLILKLFCTYHLNTEERKLLPSGAVRASVARSVISKELNDYGWFPSREQKPSGDPGGEYLQLEKKDNRIYCLHVNYECSYMRYEHKVFEFESEIDSINEYINRRNEEGLDGVDVNWKQ